MSSVDALRVAQQSDDVHRACEAIDEAVADLRKHDLDDDEIAAVSESLVGLAVHKKWEVRRAIAIALRYVRHGSVEATLHRLKGDDAARVQKAAEETLERRAERAQLDLLPYLQDERLVRMLDKMPTPQARKSALRIGAAYTEFMVRGLYHEAVRALMPVNTSLVVLKESLKSESFDRGASVERVREFRAKLRHVRAILNAARLYATETAPEYAELSPLALVEQALTSLRAHELAQQNGLDATVEIDAALRIHADATALQQVFENILKNAIEASADARPIRLTIAAKKIKQRVQFVFTDSGCGMSPEGLREIYRPYRSKKRGGTGLGMPLVKKLIELDHGGSVDVKSKPDVGTTVTITLPARQEQ